MTMPTDWLTNWGALHIGQLEAFEPRLLVAILAGAIALVAIGVVIWSAVGVLTGGHINRETLPHEAKKTHCCMPLNDPSLLAGYDSIAQVLTEFDNTITTRQALDQREQSLTEEELQTYNELNKKIAYLNVLVEHLTSAAYCNAVCRLFRDHLTKRTKSYASVVTPSAQMCGGGEVSG